MSAQKQYILVIKGSCPYCKNAISLLKENNLNFTFTDMQFNIEALEVVKLQTDWYTVPMVWEQEVDWENPDHVVISKFIGGNSELQKYLGNEEN